MTSETPWESGFGEIGRSPKLEQEIPRWNTSEERARLDIVLSDARLGEVCVDVSAVATETTDVGRGVLRAIERRGRRKHIRYPGRGLHPFVVDIRGKWGKEAHAFVQALSGASRRKKGRTPSGRAGEGLRSYC